jgi:nucleotide-binding universal stress UspA family protein
MTSYSARIRSILVPLDGSSVAEQALPVAIAIAEQARCKIKLVLVHQPPQPLPRWSSRWKRRIATTSDLS